LRCEAQGNALDLWARATGQDLYPVVLDLYQRLGRAVPSLKTAGRGANKDKNDMKDA
jgi:hypothetical protein